MWYCSMHVVFEQRHEAAGQTLMLFVQTVKVLGEGQSFGGKIAFGYRVAFET